MAVTKSIKAIPTGTFDSASLTGPFLLVGKIPERLIIFRVVNEGSTSVGISYDGISLHDVVRAGTTMELNFITSSESSNAAGFLAKGTPIYLNGTAGTGFIYVVGYYQTQS